MVPWITRLGVCRATHVHVYQAIDAAGNAIMDTLVITVLDTVAPVLAYPTEEVVLVDELPGEAVPALEAIVIDNRDTNADYVALRPFWGKRKVCKRWSGFTPQPMPVATPRCSTSSLR